MRVTISYIGYAVLCDEDLLGNEKKDGLAKGAMAAEMVLGRLIGKALDKTLVRVLSDEAKVTGKLIVHSPHAPGPLSKMKLSNGSSADSVFKGKTYIERITRKSETVYIDKSVKKALEITRDQGAGVAAEEAINSVVKAVRDKDASEWQTPNNQSPHGFLPKIYLDWVKIEIPKGVKVYEGVSSDAGNSPGSVNGTHIFDPNSDVLVIDAEGLSRIFSN